MLVTLLASIQRFNALMTNWQRLIKIASDRYRPELYYMRGPGPKWRAKHRGRGEPGVL